MADKIITIPLRRSWIKEPRGTRANRAIREIRLFLEKHEKVGEVKMSQNVHSAVWAKGLKKPLASIRVKVRKEGEVLVARLPDEKETSLKKEKSSGGTGLLGRAQKLVGKGKEETKEPKKEKAKPEKEKPIEAKATEVKAEPVERKEEKPAN